jgi:hypothetical protein
LTLGRVATRLRWHPEDVHAQTGSDDASLGDTGPP